LLAVNARSQAVYAGDKAAGFGGGANEISLRAKRSAEIADLQGMVTEDQRAYQKSNLEVDRVLQDFRLMHNSTIEFIGRMQEKAAVWRKKLPALSGVCSFKIASV
jgi:hypothetical protein